MQSNVVHLIVENEAGCYCYSAECYCPPRGGSGGSGSGGGVGVCTPGQVNAIMGAIPLNIRDAMVISATLAQWEAALYERFNGQECFHLYVTLAMVSSFEWQNIYRPVIEYFTSQIVSLETVDEHGVTYTASVTRMNDILNRMRWIRRFSYGNHTDLPDLPAEDPQVVMNALLSTLWQSFCHPEGPAELANFVDSFDP